MWGISHLADMVSLSKTWNVNQGLMFAILFQ